MQYSQVVTWTSLMQSTSLGSGSHSPFLIHVDELGPLSISSERQVNVTSIPLKCWVFITHNSDIGANKCHWIITLACVCL